MESAAEADGQAEEREGREEGRLPIQRFAGCGSEDTHAKKRKTGC